MPWSCLSLHSTSLWLQSWPLLHPGVSSAPTLPHIPAATVPIQRLLPDHCQSIHQSTVERESGLLSGCLSLIHSTPWISHPIGCLFYQCSINNYIFPLDQPQDLHLNSILATRHLACMVEYKCHLILKALANP